MATPLRHFFSQLCPVSIIVGRFSRVLGTFYHAVGDASAPILSPALPRLGSRRALLTRAEHVLPRSRRRFCTPFLAQLCPLLTLVGCCTAGWLCPWLVVLLALSLAGCAPGLLCFWLAACWLCCWRAVLLAGGAPGGLCLWPCTTFWVAQLVRRCRLEAPGAQGSTVRQPYIR